MRRDPNLLPSGSDPGAELADLCRLCSFYRDIRHNAWLRTRAFLANRSRASLPLLGEEEAPSCPCGVGCIGTFLLQALLLCGGLWLLVAFVVAPLHMPIWCAWLRRRRGEDPSCGTLCVRAGLCCCCSRRCLGCWRCCKGKEESPVPD